MTTHWQALRQQLGDVLQHWAERLRSSDNDSTNGSISDSNHDEDSGVEDSGVEDSGVEDRVKVGVDPRGMDAAESNVQNDGVDDDVESGSEPDTMLPLEALTLDPNLMGLAQDDSSGALSPSALAALCPGLREPLSVEDAVLARQMKLLKREAADALAALGAAHALVSSARLAQVQQLRPRVEAGEVPGEELMALAADYQGWQNDQVRLFDALALVLRMRVPQGMALDQVDPDLQHQARAHLQSLSVEYQRQLLQAQFQRRP